MIYFWESLTLSKSIKAIKTSVVDGCVENTYGIKGTSGVLRDERMGWGVRIEKVS
jgi:hypothetical protein